MNISVMDILSLLREDLRLSGSPLLRDMKVMENDVMVTCPVHGNGVERKPSCGISMDDETLNGIRTKAGTVHCFACGYVADLGEFISTCYGHDDKGIYGHSWILRNFYLTETIDRDITVDLSRSRSETTVQYISEDELQAYRYTHPYMYKRNLTDKVIEYFDVGFDRDTNSLTFPVHDETGKVVFIQRRGISQKVFLNERSIRKGDYLYGQYQVIRNAARLSHVVVVESILDALFCWSRNIPAVALMGARATPVQVEKLSRLPVREVVMALDNDEAGRKAGQYLFDKLKQSKMVTMIDIPYGLKDIGELTSEQLDSLLSKYELYKHGII